MQTRRVFAVIWRVNAILILLGGLGMAAVVVLAGVQLVRNTLETRQGEDGATVAVGEGREVSVELGSFSPVTGSAILIAPLQENKTYAPDASSGEGASTRNHLFFDPTTRSATWLRPTMATVILDTIALPAAEHGGERPNTVVFVYVSVERDSNGDGRLTEADAKQIAISAPNGTGYRVLVTKADELHSATLLPSGRLLLLTTLGKRLTASELETKDLASPVSRHAVVSSR